MASSTMNTRTDKLEAIVELLKANVNQYCMELKEVKEISQQAVAGSQCNKEEIKAVKLNVKVESN